MLRDHEWREMERRAVESVPLIAPELASVPVYLVDAGRLTGLAAAPRTCGACTQATLGVCLRPYVDDWRGPGVALIYSRSAILEIAEWRRWACPANNRGDRQGFIGDCFYGVFLHEMGHALHRDFASVTKELLSGPAYTETMKSEDRKKIVQFLRRERTAEDQDELTLGLGDTHGLDWLRIVLHLRDRLQRVTGRWIHPILCAPMDAFGMSGASEFEMALAAGGEYQAFSRLTFREIITWPLPQSFADIWRRDLQRLETFKSFSQGKPPMSISEKLARISKAFTIKQRVPVDSFDALVLKIAGDGEVNPAADALILDAAGKTIQDLERGVALKQLRRSQHKTVVAAAGAPKERARIAAQIAAADAELQKAYDRHSEIIGPLAWEDRQLVELERAAEAAKAELVRSAPEELHAEERRLGLLIGGTSGRRTDAHRRMGQLRESTIDAARALQGAEESLLYLRKTGAGGGIVDAEQRVAAQKKTLLDGDRELSALQAEVVRIADEEAELQLRISALRAKMIEP